MKNYFIPLVAIMAVCFSSCAPTPASRIAKMPEAFDLLNEEEKASVKEGDIAEGMSKEAVLLAWGKPGSKAEGSQDGKRIERWDYLVSSGFHGSSFHGGHGFGGGGFGRGGFGRGGFGRGFSRGGFSRRGVSSFGSSFGFRSGFSNSSRRVSSVWFRDGRVAAWERSN